MPTSKALPQTVSLRDLSGHIDRAVDIAAKQVGLTPEAHTIALRWDLFGRIVKDAALAPKFAAATVAALGPAAGKVHPAVVQIDNRTIAGFVPVELLRDMRTLG